MREAVYFEDAAALRTWLKAHADKETEVLAGLYKGGKATLTWPQLVDEVLKVGWIDGVRKTVDDDRWTIRLTPRKAGSHWSAKNLARMDKLFAEGSVTPAGKAAWERRGESKRVDYSYEKRRAPAQLEPAELKRFKAQAKAWAWFEDQAPWYRRQMLHWITAAKQPATRERRLDKIIAASAEGRRL